MEDQTDTAQAPPKQSFIEQQLGAAITPAAEREKLNRSFDAFCEELDAQAEASPTSPEPAKTSASAKVTNIELVPGTAALPPEILAELEEGRTARRAVGLVRSPEFIQAYVKPKDDAYLNAIEEMAQYFDAKPEIIKEQFLDPLKANFSPKTLPDEWLDEQIGLMKAPNSIKAKIKQKFEAARELEKQYEQAAATEMSRAQAEYEQKQAVRSYMAELNSALQNVRTSTSPICDNGYSAERLEHKRRSMPWTRSCKGEYRSTCRVESLWERLSTWLWTH
jgi:hypothetical protein